MNSNSGKRNPPPAGRDEGTGRDTHQPRRIGHSVHDDRGVASVEWRTAPSDFERPVFEIEQSAGRDEARLRDGFELSLEVKRDETFNPYDRKGDTFVGRKPAPGAVPGTSKAGKRDLRKLSEWMKMMKAMEERKKHGDE